jgi:hypothetical protein
MMMAVTLWLLARFGKHRDRSDEANTLQAIGVIHDAPKQGLQYCQRALELYRQIGDKYSQSRNLIYFTPQMLEKLGQYEEIQSCLRAGVELAQAIPYPPFVEDGEARLASLQFTSSTPQRHP